MNTKPKQRRRRYSEAFRRQVVAETMECSESVAAVALRHGLNTNLVFKWRQRYAVTSNGAAALLPIRIAPATTTLDGTGTGTDPQGHVEIRLSSGHQLRLQGEVDAALVRVVLEILR